MSDYSLGKVYRFRFIPLKKCADEQILVLSSSVKLGLFVGCRCDGAVGGLPVEDAAFEVDDAVAEAGEDFGCV